MRCFKQGFWTMALIGACILPLPAGAAVVQERSSGAATSGGDTAPETGGHPVVPSGPMRFECLQFGVRIADERRIAQIAVSPYNVIGWLSARRQGDGRRIIVMPMNGDGSVTCILSQEEER
jgi:hypothetical protein